MMTKRVRRRRSTKRKLRTRLTKRLSKRLTKRLSKRLTKRRSKRRVRHRKVRRGGKPRFKFNFGSCLTGDCVEGSSSNRPPTKPTVTPPEESTVTSLGVEDILQGLRKLEQDERDRLAKLTPEQRAVEEAIKMENTRELVNFLSTNRERNLLTEEELEMMENPPRLGEILETLGLRLNTYDTMRAIDLSGVKEQMGTGIIYKGPLTGMSEARLNRLFKEIAAIPFGIEQTNQRVKVLNLCNNNLESLPSEIGSIRSLEDLDISGNRITKLPESMKNLTDLKSLNLSSSGISEIPQWITQFKLKELFLDNLFLEGVDLTYLGEIKTLRNLSLGYNDLSQVPEWIQNLTNLTQLQLYGNYISKIPDWIGNMTQLEHIDLSQNRLSTEGYSLPMSLTKLPKLKTLTISYNPFLSDNPVIAKLEKKRGITIINQ